MSSMNLQDNITNNILDEYIAMNSSDICGVNPKEIYGSSSFSSVFNSRITPDNFVTIVLNKGSNEDSRLERDAVITMFQKSDNFSLSTSAKYSSPLETKGAGVGSVGDTAKTIMDMANPASQSMTGLSFFNKLAYLPIWGGSGVLTFDVAGILFATSDPLTQVQQPIDLLQRFVTPMQLNSYQVAGPGPVIDPVKVKEFLSSMTKNINGGDDSIGMDNFNFSSLFTKNDMVSVKLGGVALISPVVITRFAFSCPNRQTEFKTSSKSVSTMAYTYAEVNISFMTYFPLVFTGDAQDYDSVKLFPSSQYSKSSSTWDKLKNGDF